MNLIWTGIGVLIILWILGFSINLGGGLIHILLVLAVIGIVYNVFMGRSAWAFIFTQSVDRLISDDIEIKLPDSFINADSDIAAAAIHHIDWFTTIFKRSAIIDANKIQIV